MNYFISYHIIWAVCEIKMISHECSCIIEVIKQVEENW